MRLASFYCAALFAAGCSFQVDGIDETISPSIDLAHPRPDFTAIDNPEVGPGDVDLTMIGPESDLPPPPDLIMPVTLPDLTVPVTPPDLTVPVTPPDLVALAAPVLTSIAPTIGSIAGGTSVTLSGANFRAGATVTVGGAPATVGVTTATSITITTPAGKAGSASVIVTNPDKQASAGVPFHYELTTLSFAATAVTVGGNPEGLAAGLLKGDAAPDLVAVGGFSLNILTNDGKGTFTNATQGTMNGAAIDVAITDVNGDAANDIVLGHTNIGGGMGGVSAFLFQSGPKTFTAGAAVASGPSVNALALADLVTPGARHDVVTVVNPGTAEVTSLALAGGAYTSKSMQPVKADPRKIAAADFDGDGKTDVVVTEATSSSVSILPGTGGGALGAAVHVALAGGHQPVGVAVGNFNGDSKPDLALCLTDSNQILFLFNTSTPGSVSFSAMTATAAVGTYPIGVAVGDFNLDGNTDVVVANRGGIANVQGSVSVLLLDGMTAALLGSRVDTNVGNNPEGIVAADFNGDGKLDWAVANYGSGSVSVGLNTAAQ